MRIERDLDLPSVPPEELWRALTDPDVLAEWLADDAALDPSPGGSVRVEDAEAGDRDGVVTRVEPGRRLSFDWWSVEHPDDASSVDLVVLPSGTGSRLIVTETALMPGVARSLSARASAVGEMGAWDRRLVVLAALAARRPVLVGA